MARAGPGPHGRYGHRVGRVALAPRNVEPSRMAPVRRSLRAGRGCLLSPLGTWRLRMGLAGLAVVDVPHRADVDVWLGAYVCRLGHGSSFLLELEAGGLPRRVSVGSRGGRGPLGLADPPPAGSAGVSGESQLRTPSKASGSASAAASAARRPAAGPASRSAAGKSGKSAA